LFDYPSFKTLPPPPPLLLLSLSTMPHPHKRSWFYHNENVEQRGRCAARTLVSPIVRGARTTPKKEATRNRVQVSHLPLTPPFPVALVDTPFFFSHLLSFFLTCTLFTSHARTQSGAVKPGVAADTPMEDPGLGKRKRPQVAVFTHDAHHVAAMHQKHERDEVCDGSTSYLLRKVGAMAAEKGHTSKGAI
jgi:hypothetical protein